MTTFKRLIVWPILALAGLVSACEPTVEPTVEPTSFHGCVKPGFKPGQAHSIYLPLSVGNEWSYRKSVSNTVYAWEQYYDFREKKATLVVGTPPDIQPGVSEETYRITDTMKSSDGLPLWVVNVHPITARDGRYGAWYTRPDRILWGRMPSNPALIQINEFMMIDEGYLHGAKRFDAPLVIETIADGIAVVEPNTDVKIRNAHALTSVDTPIGVIPCALEIITEVNGGKYTWMTQSYYAPNIGLVKEIQKDGAGKVTYVLELLRYTVKP